MTQIPNVAIETQKVAQDATTASVAPSVTSPLDPVAKMKAERYAYVVAHTPPSSDPKVV
jgi:hypothetical protein